MAVPLDTSTTPQAKRMLQTLEAEHKRDAEERITGWTVIWTLFAFKMATVGIIWYAANGSAEANAFLTVTTWYWMTIPVVALSGFIGYRLRLRKARKQADALRDAEFRETDSPVEPMIFTDEEVRKLMALERRRRNNDRPGEE